jgi:hypothetical protein
MAVLRARYMTLETIAPLSDGFQRRAARRGRLTNPVHAGDNGDRAASYTTSRDTTRVRRAAMLRKRHRFLAFLVAPGALRRRESGDGLSISTLPHPVGLADPASVAPVLDYPSLKVGPDHVTPADDRRDPFTRVAGRIF